MHRLIMDNSDRAPHLSTRFAILALVLVVIQLTGCASAPVSEAIYNPVTGYPAVGDRSWHL